ncbi:MAG: hypothetical protein ABI688_07385, partial [Bacteroidota bacterium]
SELAITQPANGKMIVKVSQPEVEYSGSIPWVDIDGEGLDITKDTLKIANVKIEDVLLSSDNNYHVEIKKYSRGRTPAEAETRAQKLQFNASYNDSVLDLGSHIAIDKDSKFRGQKVIVIIRVPAGKKIRFDETIDKLHSFDITINERRRRWDRNDKRDWEIDDNAFGYRTNTDYTMGANGQLKDEKGVTVTNTSNTNPENGEYRYPATDSVEKTDIQKQIEDEKRKQDERNKESERKIKELQDKQKSTGTKPTVLKTKGNNKTTDEAFAGGPSPVSSLVQWF